MERAYWWTEVLDAYCRILMLSKGLGRVNYFTEPEAQGLLELKGKWGMNDPRTEIKNCDIFANNVFRESWKDTGVARAAFSPPSFKSGPSSNGTADQEALIQAITDRVLAELSKRK